MPMTFQQFQATGRDVADLGTVIDDLGLDGVAGRVYHGDAFIMQADADGGFNLVIHNEQFFGPLAEMESLLYLWCLEECGDDMGVSDELAQALCRIEKITGFRELAAAIASSEPSSMDDWCDTNAVVVDLYGYSDTTDSVIAQLHALERQVPA